MINGKRRHEYRCRVAGFTVIRCGNVLRRLGWRGQPIVTIRTLAKHEIMINEYRRHKYIRGMTSATVIRGRNMGGGLRRRNATVMANNTIIHIIDL